MRPVRAKALKLVAIYKAFALTGRLADWHYTQGAALGYELLPLQGVLLASIALGYELLGLQPVLEPHAILEYKSSPFVLTKTFACAHFSRHG